MRRPDGRGPLGVLRALDAESQLRPIDALVTFGAPARLIARVLPAELRGPLAVDRSMAPAAAATLPREVPR